MVQVSVPYRGLIFLNVNKISIVSRETFPSPTGDLYFSIALKLFYENKDVPVSVPYRGLIFLNYFRKYLQHEKRVSVPYRGLIFLNSYEEISKEELAKFVSVPYRGLIFLNTISAIPCKH